MRKKSRRSLLFYDSAALLVVSFIALLLSIIILCASAVGCMGETVREQKGDTYSVYALQIKLNKYSIFLKRKKGLLDNIYNQINNEKIKRDYNRMLKLLDLENKWIKGTLGGIKQFLIDYNRLSLPVLRDKAEELLSLHIDECESYMYSFMHNRASQKTTEFGGYLEGMRLLHIINREDYLKWLSKIETEANLLVEDYRFNILDTLLRQKDEDTFHKIALFMLKHLERRLKGNPIINQRGGYVVYLYGIKDNALKIGDTIAVNNADEILSKYVKDDDMRVAKYISESRLLKKQYRLLNRSIYMGKIKSILKIGYRVGLIKDSTIPIEKVREIRDKADRFLMDYKTVFMRPRDFVNFIEDILIEYSSYSPTNKELKVFSDYVSSGLNEYFKINLWEIKKFFNTNASQIMSLSQMQKINPFYVGLGDESMEYESLGDGCANALIPELVHSDTVSAQYVVSRDAYFKKKPDDYDSQLKWLLKQKLQYKTCAVTKRIINQDVIKVYKNKDNNTTDKIYVSSYGRNRFSSEEDVRGYWRKAKTKKK